MSESHILEYWPEGIAAARIPANNNVRLLQALKINPAISATTAAQPGSPTEGDVYILPASPTGSQWASFFEDDVVIYYNATWTAYTPVEGLRKFVEDEGEDWQYIGDSSGGWAPAGGGGGGAVDSVNGQTGIVVLELDDLDDVNAATPSDQDVLTWDAGTSRWISQAGGGAGGSPGGSDTQVQFNDAGVFGGDAGLVYDKTTDTLTLVNATFTGLLLTAASASGSAGLRLPHGAAPTTPTNGDVWTTTAGMYVRVNGATVGPLAAAGGGSLTGFTSSLQTASPNNTINASVLTPDGGTTIQDIVLQPKTVAGGSVMLTIPDNLAAGGNKRGANAIDWQIQRSAATQVASGVRSFIAGGEANTASGQNSFAAGSNSLATNTNAVAIGATAQASAVRATAIGGSGSTASATDSTVIGGGTANAVESFAFGPGAHTRTVIGSISEGSSSQQPRARMTLYGSTTSATPVLLTTNAGAAAATNQYSLGTGVNNQAAIIHGMVIARHTGSGRTKSWFFYAHLNSVSTTVSLAASVTPTIIADPGPETWSVAVTANNTTKSLAVTATGEASTTIRWQCFLNGMEVSGF